ncbi:hypothetical protein BH10BDE1_BH10BDE1_34590 [soil metagenome]
MPFSYIFASVLTLIASTVYSIGLLLSVSSVWDNCFSIAFCLIALAAFIKIVRTMIDEPENSVDFVKSISFVLLMTAAIHIGILIGFALMDAPDARLWAFDSYNLHIPSAVNIANALAGDEPIRLLRNSSDRIYATQIFVGAFFYIFGINPIASGLALLIAKLATVSMTGLLGRQLFNKKSAVIAAAAYSLLPTIVFYTTTYYKEAFIHLFVVSLLYVQIRIFRMGANPKRIALVCVLLLLIANERFYLFPLFLLSTAWAVFAGRAYSRSKFIVFGSIAAAGLAVFFIHFSDSIDFSNIFAEIARFKSEYNSYPDVDRKWNFKLMYPLGVLKLFLSPYFHPRKFDLFSNFSLLLIWGSFFSQILLLCGAYEIIRTVWQQRLEFLQTKGFLFLPFLGFMAVFGYVAPFAGRLRDAFVPLFAIYFAVLLLRSLQRRPGVKA